jgi:hypothetical protein
MVSTSALVSFNLVGIVKSNGFLGGTTIKSLRVRLHTGSICLNHLWRADMKDSYNFTLDPNNFTQLGETRFFEIQADKESVERFIKDLELFEKKRSEEDE